MKNKLYVIKEGIGFRWKYTGTVKNPVVAIESNEGSDYVTFTYEDGMKQAVKFDCDGRIINLEEE